jgi:putative transposase
MPRRARLRLGGVPLHLIQRGNNRTACFFADDDYRLYLQHLEALAPKFECAVHAYVLMTNHVHLLLTPDRLDGPSLLMKHLGQRYVQYVNRVYSRSGTLWEGRFRSSIVQSQRYLLRCQCYIELNPVRAGMVAHPGDYPWSSYRSNVQSPSSRLITPHGEYTALASTDQERVTAYRALFASALDATQLADIRFAVNAGFALGNDRFKAEIAAVLGRRVEPGASGRPKTNKAFSNDGQLRLP